MTTKINPELIKLIKELEPFTPNERLEILLEIVRTCGFKELEKAIISYWFDLEYDDLQITSPS